MKYNIKKENGFTWYTNEEGNVVRFLHGGHDYRFDKHLNFHIEPASTDSFEIAFNSVAHKIACKTTVTKDEMIEMANYMKKCINENLRFDLDVFETGNWAWYCGMFNDELLVAMSSKEEVVLLHLMEKTAALSLAGMLLAYSNMQTE